MSYKNKSLFKNTNATFGKEPTIIESVWAYLHIVGEEKRTGRYRIRISKMDASAMIAMGFMNPEDAEPDAVYFGIQGALDQWHTKEGWLSLFDWVGDPNDSTFKIEKDLNKQMESFVTGVSLTEDFAFTLPPKPQPKREPVKDKEKKESDKKIDKPAQDTDDSSDFDWL